MPYARSAVRRYQICRVATLEAARPEAVILAIDRIAARNIHMASLEPDKEVTGRAVTDSRRISRAVMDSRRISRAVMDSQSTGMMASVSRGISRMVTDNLVMRPGVMGRRIILMRWKCVRTKRWEYCLI